MESNIRIRPAGLPGDWGWITMAHGEVYTKQYGWSSDIEIDTARAIVQFIDNRDQGREECWIAEFDGKRIGCVMCVKSDKLVSAARLRLLLVHPDARGSGVGSKLVKQCITFAREKGYESIYLWTLDVLNSAKKLYCATGFEKQGEEQMHVFGNDMVAETWSLDLT